MYEKLAAERTAGCFDLSRATTFKLDEVLLANHARTADRLDNPRTVIFGPSPAQLGPGEKLR